MNEATIATRRPHGIRVGDQLHIAGKPSRERPIVAEALSATELRLVVHVRPSRGFAKHVRRQKQWRR